MIKYCEQCKILRPKRLFKGLICKKGYMEMIEYYYNSNVKQSDLKDFFRGQFVNFMCQKYVKKKVHGNGETTLP